MNNMQDSGAFNHCDNSTVQYVEVAGTHMPVIGDMGFDKERIEFAVPQEHILKLCRLILATDASSFQIVPIIIKSKPIAFHIVAECIKQDYIIDKLIETGYVCLDVVSIDSCTYEEIK